MSQATKTLPNTNSYSNNSAGDTPELVGHQTGDNPSTLDALRRAMQSTQSRESSANDQSIGRNRDQNLNQLPADFLERQQRQAELEERAKRVRELKAARNREEVFNQARIKEQRETKARVIEITNHFKAEAAQREAPREVTNNLSMTIPDAIGTGVYYDNNLSHIGRIISKFDPNNSADWKVMQQSIRRGPGSEMVNARGNSGIGKAVQGLYKDQESSLGKTGG